MTTVKEQALTQRSDYKGLEFNYRVNHERYNVLYVMEDLFDRTLKFDTTDNIAFELDHQFAKLEEAPSYEFRIYVTEPDPVPIAKIYRNYIIEQGEFKTLKEKVKKIRIFKNFMVQCICIYGIQQLLQMRVWFV